MGGAVSLTAIFDKHYPFLCDTALRTNKRVVLNTTESHRVVRDHVGREQVGCWWLSAITLHSVIMPPPAAASNLNSSLDSFLRAGGRTQPKNNLEHAGHSSGQKYLLGWLVCRTGG